MSFGIVIPYHGERYRWTMNTVRNIHQCPFIDEIVINAEPGNGDSLRVKQASDNYKNVRFMRNDLQLGPLKNKIESVRRCRSEWVVLVDSDNVLNKSYFPPQITNFQLCKDVIYCPESAMPKFDFKRFVGSDINFKSSVEMLGTPMFEVLLNDGNYLFHRKTWLDAMDSAEEFDPVAVDVLWANFNCLKRGMVMKVIPGMVYTHSIHQESTYLKTHDRSRAAAEEIKKKMRDEYENRRGAVGVPAETEVCVPGTSNFAASRGPGGRMVRQPSDSDPTELLTD